MFMILIDPKFFMKVISPEKFPYPVGDYENCGAHSHNQIISEFLAGSRIISAIGKLPCYKPKAFFWARYDRAVPSWDSCVDEQRCICSSKVWSAHNLMKNYFFRKTRTFLSTHN